MKRDLLKLSAQTYDLLIIGGGITGAAIAWDATLRGLRVALLEKGDFGGATSANSLKTVHGGLRYLQEFNLPQVRKMVRERQALLRIAPHLVRPLPVILPTLKHKPMKSLPVLGTAVKLNDLVSLDRNIGMDPGQQLPNGRVLSRKALRKHLPGLAENDQVSGGILWYDAQMQNSERLTLAFIQSAVDAGASVANYLRVDNYLLDGKRVVGVQATDLENGRSLPIQASLVINAAGPWVDELLYTLRLSVPQPRFRLSTAMNLVTRQLIPDVALGINSTYVQTMENGRVERRSRVLFIAPWQNQSLIGTLHAPYADGHPEDRWVTEPQIIDFINEINQAYPAANLQRKDVKLVHRGMLPMVPNPSDPATVKLLRSGQVVDHEQDGGVEGLLSAVGVKYTTARYLAEKTVDAAFRKLRRRIPNCRTRHARLLGGQIHHIESFTSAAMEKWPVEMPPFQIQRLLTSYGNLHRQLLPIIEEDPVNGQPLTAETAVTRAEIIHAVRDEMAIRLSDVVLRRTDMGSAGPPPAAALEACAELMADLLGWDKDRIDEEIDQVANSYAPLRIF